MAISCFIVFVGYWGWNGWLKHFFSFGRISSWAPVGLCNARSGDGGLTVYRQLRAQKEDRQWSKLEPTP